MSDSDDTNGMHPILKQMEREREAARAQARQTLAETCDFLKELGVTQANIAYDGYGDSGTIDSVTAFAEENREVALPDDLVDALSEAACQLLPCGWEINEGSYGELVLDVAGRRISRQHNWRSTEYDEEEIGF